MSLLTVVLATVFGAIGWWITHRVHAPIQRIEDLRQRAHEELVFYANINMESPEADLDAARPALRRVAAGLISMAETANASPLITWWIERKGWDLLVAGQGLLAVANTIVDGEPNLQVVARDNLDRALNLPPRFPSEVVMKACAALQIPAPSPNRNRRRP